MQKPILVITTIVLLAAYQAAGADSPTTVTLSWEWDPGDSGYTSGPNGEVAFDVFMRTEDDDTYDYADPWKGGVEDCWWDQFRYSCRTDIAHEFQPDLVYYFTVVAYLIGDPGTRSSDSDEIDYSVDAPNRGSSGGGGGCFLGAAGSMFERD